MRMALTETGLSSIMTTPRTRQASLMSLRCSATKHVPRDRTRSGHRARPIDKREPRRSFSATETFLNRPSTQSDQWTGRPDSLTVETPMIPKLLRRRSADAKIRTARRSATASVETGVDDGRSNFIDFSQALRNA